ncbi:MAG: YadA C-terminal domain-containing protein [Pseudomonadota bacterium]
MHSRAIIIAALPVFFAFSGGPAAAQTVRVDDGTDTTFYESAGPVLAAGVTTGTPSVATIVQGAAPGTGSVLQVTGAFVDANVYAPNSSASSLYLSQTGANLAYFDVPSGMSSAVQAVAGGTFVGAYSTATTTPLVGLYANAATLQNTFLGVTNTVGIVNAGDIATTTLSTTGNATVGGALVVTGATTTYGIANTGDIATTTLSATGNVTVGGGLAVAGVAQTHGIDNNGNVIRGVAAGQAATDAANVGQLSALAADQAVVNGNQAAINNVQASVNAAQTTVNERQSAINAAQATTNAQVQNRLDENRKVASTGSAIAMAAGSIPALEAGRQAGLGVGVGNYDGRSALAIGVAARVSDALQLKFNVGTGAGGKASAGAGGMWSW